MVSTESTPLIKSEESGISLEAATNTTPSSQATTPSPTPADEENGIPPEHPTNHRRWGKTTNNPNKSTLPSWSQAFKVVSPFLRPRDRRHALLAFLALLTVLLEKLITVLPPLAIRHAVDAISVFSSSDSSTDDESSSSYSEIQQQTAHTVSMSILVYFLLRTLNASISSLQSVCQRAVSLDAERRFASNLFSHMQILGAAYHLERHAGQMLQVLSRGSNATSTIIDSLWFNLMPTFFEAAVVGTVFWKMLGIPSIAFTTLASVVLYLVYTVKVTNTRMEQRRKVLDKSEEVGRIETETLVNYETVVMFGRERKEVDAYDVVRKEYTEERVKMLGLFAWLQLGQQSIRLAGTCVGLWLAGRATVYGIRGTGDDLLSPGSFVVVQLYIQQLFQPLSFLGFTYRQLTEALTDLEKAVKMLRSKPLVMDAKDAVEWDVALEQQKQKKQVVVEPPVKDAITASSGDITFDNVSFRYKVKAQRKIFGGPDNEDGSTNNKGGGGGRRGKGKRGFGPNGLWGQRGRQVWSGSGGVNFWIKSAKKDKDDDSNQDDDETEKVQIGGIQNLSFNIPAGKTAALVGPSGGGKTTIVRLILRMYDPDDGSVLVDNINVKSLLQQSLRSNIGVVAQDTILFHASLRDNITYGKEDATEDEIWEAVRISALEPLVKSLPEGLETLVGERGMKLSGGERQRVGLARCIIKQPKLVLLDEATSALDSGTEREIQRNILTPHTAAAVCRGRTTLMIAHRLSTARRADVILVLDKGQLVEQGTHEELLAVGPEQGMYARMWRDQMEGDSLDELK
ncbi:hypothetical protein ACHAXR_008106 [Thalassiosira sp. AJA248-18]